MQLLSTIHPSDTQHLPKHNPHGFGITWWQCLLAGPCALLKMHKTAQERTEHDTELIDMASNSLRLTIKHLCDILEQVLCMEAPQWLRTVFEPCRRWGLHGSDLKVQGKISCQSTCEWCQCWSTATVIWQGVPGAKDIQTQEFSFNPSTWPKGLRQKDL